MDGDQRRNQMLQILEDAGGPVPGAALGQKLGVSRQVVVGDIALLRAQGQRVVSTNRGYVLEMTADPVRLIKVRHTEAQTETELNTIVDLGGCVLDVMVNHRTYGRVEAPLGIRSRRDVRAFLSDLAAGVSSPLMNITDGYHFHSVSAPSEQVLDEIEAALGELGFLAPLTQFEREAL